MVFKEKHKPVVVFLTLELVNRNIFSLGIKGGEFCPDRRGCGLWCCVLNSGSTEIHLGSL